MKKLVVEVKIIAYGMVKHVAKAFLHLQVFLPAFMAKVSLQIGSAVKAIGFVPVMLFHSTL
jgi:hypothetical protein